MVLQQIFCKESCQYLSNDKMVFVEALFVWNFDENVYGLI